MTNPVAELRTTGTPGEAGPAGRGTRVRQALSAGVLRFAMVAGSTAMVSAMTFKGSAGTTLDGLPALLLTVAVVGSWSAVDAWRQALAEPVVAWSLATVLLVAAAPLTLTLSYRPGEDVVDRPGAYLAAVGDGAGPVLLLTAVPAVVGLVVGRLVRRSQANRTTEIAAPPAAASE